MVRAPFLKRCDPETIHTSTIFRGMFAFENDRLWRLYVEKKTLPPTPTLFGKISEILKSKSRRDSGPFFLVHKCHGVLSCTVTLTCLKAGAHGRGRPRRPGPLPAAGRGRGTHLACCRLPVADHRQTSTLPRVRRTMTAS